jgi:hypothetical protein
MTDTQKLLLDSLDRHKSDPWYVACLHAALEENHDPAEAVKIAEEAFKQPMPEIKEQEDDAAALFGGGDVEESLGEEAAGKTVEGVAASHAGTVQESREVDWVEVGKQLAESFGVDVAETKDASGHEHASDTGQFTSKGGGNKDGNAAAAKKNNAMKTKHLKIDADAQSNFLETGQATAFRVHNVKKPLPKESVSTWADDESKTMPGVSGLANFGNALADMLLGENESTTGENYTKSVRANRGEPAIVAMMGKYIDGPGAEVVVPSPKIAHVFTHADAEKAFRQALKESIIAEPSEGAKATDADTMTWDQLDSKYVLKDSSLLKRTEEILIENARESFGGEK